MPYHCNYCEKINIPTLRGLRLHLTQAPGCQVLARKALRRHTRSDSDTESNSNRSPTPDSPKSDETNQDIEMDSEDSPIHQYSPSGSLRSIRSVASNGDDEMYDMPIPSAEGWQPPRPRELPRPQPGSRIVEVPDEDDVGVQRWVEDFPRPAGTPQSRSQGYFAKIRDSQKREGLAPWAPYADMDEWELAHWLMKNVGQNETDKFLRLKIVRTVHQRIFYDI